VAAADGTTNALGLPRADVFAALYGPDSAGQFRAHAAALGIEYEELALPNLVDDVDTVVDLVRVGANAGSRTGELLEAIAL
jgi:2-phospho-L-lactate guanylyltransferase (CobY/MobA/RfbA family)